MDPERGKYVRVYYSVVNDERFADVYHDARRIGTWLQLLLVADAMYPADAPIPAYVHRPSFAMLVQCGLIEERPHQHYRIHGLASERAVRSESARNAAALRWQSVRTADPMPRRAEHRQEEREQIAPDPEEDDEPEFPVLQWLSAHGCYQRPGNGYHQKLVLAVERHSAAELIAAMERLSKAGVRDGDVKGLLFGAIDACDAASRPNLRALEAEEGAEERAAIRSRRIDEQMQARRLERWKYAGEWHDEWGPKPEAQA